MITDFFHPSVGGVENHIFMLSANLIRKGHKVSDRALGLSLIYSARLRRLSLLLTAILQTVSAFVGFYPPSKFTIYRIQL